jgi:hypothetical protein
MRKENFQDRNRGLIHSYLDDSLIKELNPDILLSHSQTVIDLLLELGFLIS